MTELDLDTLLWRTAASAAVEAIGWRYLLGTLSVSIPVCSLPQAIEAATAAVAASEDDADDQVRVDLRPDRVEVSVQTRALSAVTGRDAQLARHVADAVDRLRLGPAGADAGDRD